MVIPAALAIESLRSLAAEALPAGQHYVYIARIEFERGATPAGPLAGDQGGAREVEYWTTSGVRKEKMRDFPLAVAELGEQGWEMTVGLPGVLLFRRRVEAV